MPAPSIRYSKDYFVYSRSVRLWFYGTIQGPADGRGIAQVGVGGEVPAERRGAKFTHKKNSLAVDVLQEGVAISEFSFNLVEEVFKSNLHLPAVAVAHAGIPSLGGIFAIDLVH